MLKIDESDLGARVEQLSWEAIDELAFGVIRLDASGKIVYLSRVEARESGYGDRPAIGRDFFSEVAPCLGTPEFMRRLDQAQARGSLDITFDQVGDFGDPERELHVRVRSATSGGLWIFIERGR